MEELGDLLREWRAPRDRGAEPPAQALLDLRVDEPVCDAVFERQEPRDGLAPLAQEAHLPAHVERPVDQSALDACCGREVRGDRGVHLLQHARHGREDRRPHLRHHLADAARVGQERDRVAEVRAQQVHEPPEVVCERQVEEQDVAREEEVLDLVDPSDHLVVVPVEDHAGLGRAGRPGRVDEREEVVVADLGARLVQGARVSRCVLAAERAKLVECLERVDVLGARGLDLGELLVVFDQAADDVRVLEDVTGLGRGAGRIDRRRDGSDLGEGEVEEHPLEPGPREDPEGIALLDA